LSAPDITVMPKGQRRALLVVVALLAIPLVPAVLLFLLASRPFCRYEFVVFRCSGRLSFLVDGLEAAMARRQQNDRKVTTIAVPLGDVVNQELLQMYRRHLLIVSPRELILQQALIFAGACLPVLRWVGHPSSDLSVNDHSLSRNSEFAQAALSERRRLGISAGVQHVVFSFSDPNYYRQHMSREMEEYHARRNSDLEVLVEQLRLLPERGLAAVRVGIKGQDLEGSSLSEVIFDGQAGRSEAGEIALISAARFGWSDASGAWWAWAAFGLPILLTNAFSLRTRMTFPNNLVYLPTLYRRQDGSLLTFGEMLRAGNKLSRQEHFEGTLIERVSPSTRHVRAAIDEVLTLPQSRTASRAVRQDVEQLMERLKVLFRRNDQPPNVGMASQFLIDHAHLIDD